MNGMNKKMTELGGQFSHRTIIEAWNKLKTTQAECKTQAWGGRRHNSDLTVWERYEIKKSELQQRGLTQREYELAVCRLANELEL
ncbi:MAG: hypothetical protein ACRC6D_01720 [Aeromonas sp.]